MAEQYPPLTQSLNIEPIPNSSKYPYVSKEENIGQIDPQESPLAKFVTESLAHGMNRIREAERRAHESAHDIRLGV